MFSLCKLDVSGIVSEPESWLTQPLSTCFYILFTCSTFTGFKCLTVGAITSRLAASKYARVKPCSSCSQVSGGGDWRAGSYQDKALVLYLHMRDTEPTERQ